MASEQGTEAFAKAVQEVDGMWLLWPNVRDPRRWVDRKSLLFTLEELAKDVTRTYRPTVETLDAPAAANLESTVSRGSITYDEPERLSSAQVNARSAGLTPGDDARLLEPSMPDCGRLHFYCVRKVIRYCVCTFSCRTMNRSVTGAGIKLVKNSLPTLEKLQ